jgi:DNA-binding XRE family transcriptional regulator
MPTPLHKPTDQNRRTVEAMSAYGIPHEEIAEVIGISRKTLTKHYQRELNISLAKANAKIAEKLFARAAEGDVKAMMFWLERRGGEAWKNKPVVTFQPADFTIDINPTDVLELPIDDDETTT